jgi:hypothetical protein
LEIKRRSIANPIRFLLASTGGQAHFSDCQRAQQIQKVKLCNDQLP